MITNYYATYITIRLESMKVTADLYTNKNQYVTVVDLPGAYMRIENHQIVNMLLRDISTKIMVKI